MQTKLAKYFPMIRTEREIMDEIYSKPQLLAVFSKWSEPRRREFLDFCTGVRGVKILYDFMFKEIFNPELSPGNIEALLSALLGRNVRILTILPMESARFGDEQTLLIKDIVAELDDHKIVNVEVQKIGARFPGQRAACYSADLLLRQYKRVREQFATDGEAAKKFSYRDIHTVYTIVFFEHSPEIFFKYHDQYLHRFEQKSDTGLEMNLLQKYIMISLDSYRKIHQNKSIQNLLEGWLTFLSSDNPDDILELISAYPMFEPLYRHIYSVCRNMEDIMGIFSEELAILDRNTVLLTIDEMQEEIDELKKQKEAITSERDALSHEIDAAMQVREALINEKDAIISEQNCRIAELEKQLAALHPDARQGEGKNA